MPLAVKKSDIAATIDMLRVVEEQAADLETAKEAHRLYTLWHDQLRPETIIITDPNA